MDALKFADPFKYNKSNQGISEGDFEEQKNTVVRRVHALRHSGLN